MFDWVCIVLATANLYSLEIYLFLVALNYQTTCEEMLINQSRFKLNGNVGYVRKPEFLLSKSFDPANSKTFPRKTPLRFKVKVSFLIRLIIRPIKITGYFQIISGQQIPKPNLSTKGEVVDPYVKVRVCGLDCDDHNIVTNNKYTTKTINNNGFRLVLAFHQKLTEMRFQTDYSSSLSN